MGQMGHLGKVGRMGKMGREPLRARGVISGGDAKGSQRQILPVLSGHHGQSAAVLLNLLVSRPCD